MDVKKIKELLDSPEYDFLRTNEHLAGKIGMLCLGGSLAYGTNLEGSGDVDLRGFAFESPKELIGSTAKNSFITASAAVRQAMCSDF